jgi:hypothetical protein
MSKMDCAAKRITAVGALSICMSAALPAAANEPEERDQSWWSGAGELLSTVAADGRTNLFLSGRAHHSRSTYHPDRVHKLNERAWGGGIGRTYRSDDGNDHTLYAMAIRDSNHNVQWSAGYAYQWIYSVPKTALEAGIGLTASLISRRDWFDGIPFPAVLPLLSAGTQEVKLMATYVPRLSTRKGKGDVLLLFLNFSL